LKTGNKTIVTDLNFLELSCRS